jgi:hypothetical protein
MFGPGHLAAVFDRVDKNHRFPREMPGCGIPELRTAGAALEHDHAERNVRRPKDALFARSG